MPALRQGQAVCRLPDVARDMRRLRARLRLHRCRRRARRVHHPLRGRDRGRLGLDRRGEIPAAVLGACGAVAAADPGGHALAVARDEVAADRVAIPSQGRGGPADREDAKMNEAARPRAPWGFGVFTLVMIAIFIGLGLWQLQRRVEKHALIAALTERLAAAPVPLPPASEWGGLNAAKDEFRRVNLTATYPPLPDAMVYSAGSAVRE